MQYKAGESAFALKDYEKAVEHFEKSAELSFQKGFDRFGVSALEYARDCYKSLGKNAKSKSWTRRSRKSRRSLKKHSRKIYICSHLGLFRPCSDKTYLFIGLNMTLRIF